MFRLLRSKPFLISLDLVASMLAMIVASRIAPKGPDWLPASLVMLGSWVLFSARARLYSARFITRRVDEIKRVSDSTLAATATSAVVCFTARLEVGRGWLALSALLGMVLISAERELVRTQFDRLRRHGRLRRRVVLVGDNAESLQLETMFVKEPELGYDVVWVVSPSGLDESELAARVVEVAEEFDAGSVLVAASGVEHASTSLLIRQSVERGLHVELTSTLSDIEPGRLTVRPLGRFPVVYVEPSQRGGWRAVAKRSFDLVAASIGLVLTAPIFVGMAIAIRLDSKGPVLFRQQRVGRNGVLFPILKFRTMVPDAESIFSEWQTRQVASGPIFKLQQDPRVTRVGRVLRKTSLDELPQLWNVVRGEMSLVGPRPALPHEMEAWDEELYNRLRVRPGITGMWQVSGRSDTGFEEYTRLDLYYVDNWSLVVDLVVLLRTVPAVLKSEGAY